MASVAMRDVSPGGHLLGDAVVRDLADRASLRDILRARIHAEVEHYNRERGPTYRGLVQPEDATRYSDGFRRRRTDPLDADRLMLAVQEAVAAGLVTFDCDGMTVTDLDHVVDVTGVQQITTVMLRPIVARNPSSTEDR